MEALRTGRLIEQVRKEKKMTQSELADALGVSKQAVSNWEHGKRFPDVSLIEIVSEKLDLSIAELIKGERMSEKTIDVVEVDKLIFDALHVQKKTINKRWFLISLICVAFTVAISLGYDYLLFYEKLLFVSFGMKEAFAVLISIVFGSGLRWFSTDDETFFDNSLVALAILMICEAFAAIGFKNEALGEVFGLVLFSAEAAWYIFCGIVGAWVTHLIFAFRKAKRKG
jgi:transcriptional regulator with XRE-family HTH domain